MKWDNNQIRESVLRNGISCKSLRLFKYENHFSPNTPVNGFVIMEQNNVCACQVSVPPFEGDKHSRYGAGSSAWRWSIGLKFEFHTKYEYGMKSEISWCHFFERSQYDGNGSACHLVVKTRTSTVMAVR